MPERLCWQWDHYKAISVTRPCFAGQWLPAPGELEGAASDGLDSAAERHHAQWLHASHPRRPQGWEDVQAQLLRGRNLVRHISCFTSAALEAGAGKFLQKSASRLESQHYPPEQAFLQRLMLVMSTDGFAARGSLLTRGPT